MSVRPSILRGSIAVAGCCAALWLACSAPPSPTPGSLSLSVNFPDAIPRNTPFTLTARAVGVDGGTATGEVRFRIDDGTFELDGGADGGAVRDRLVALSSSGEATIQAICDNRCPTRTAALATWEANVATLTLNVEPAPVPVDAGAEVFTMDSCASYTAGTALLLADLTPGGRQLGIRDLSRPAATPCIGLDLVPQKLAVLKSGSISYLYDGGVYRLVADALLRDAGSSFPWAYPNAPRGNDVRLTTNCSVGLADYIPSAIDDSLVTVCSGAVLIGSQQITSLGTSGETPAKLWAARDTGHVLAASTSGNLFVVSPQGLTFQVNELNGKSIKAARGSTTGFEVVVLNAASARVELWTVTITSAAATAALAGEFLGTEEAVPTAFALDNAQQLFMFAGTRAQAPDGGDTDAGSDAGFDGGFDGGDDGGFDAGVFDAGVFDAGVQFFDGGVSLINLYSLTASPQFRYRFSDAGTNYVVPVFQTPFTGDARLFSGP